jgi:hypothetical protein
MDNAKSEVQGIRTNTHHQLTLARMGGKMEPPNVFKYIYIYIGYLSYSLIKIETTITETLAVDPMD